MLDELENITPTLAVYVLITIGLFVMFNYWRDSGMEISLFTQVSLHIVMLPITYFIINFYANK